MGVIITLLLLLGLGVLWAFLKLSPRHEFPHQVKVFNLAVLALCAVVCLTWFFKMRAYLLPLGRLEYLPLLGLGGGLLVESVFLAVFLLIRNFFVFKGQGNRPGRW